MRGLGADPGGPGQALVAINTFAPIARSPTLVAIDGARGTFRRYWPKYPHGFLTELADCPADLPAAMLRQAIEDFRQKGFAK